MVNFVEEKLRKKTPSIHVYHTHVKQWEKSVYAKNESHGFFRPYAVAPHVCMQWKQQHGYLV